MTKIKFFVDIIILREWSSPLYDTFTPEEDSLGGLSLLICFVGMYFSKEVLRFLQPFSGFGIQEVLPPIISTHRSRLPILNSEQSSSTTLSWFSYLRPFALPLNTLLSVRLSPILNALSKVWLI